MIYSIQAAYNSEKYKKFIIPDDANEFICDKNGKYLPGNVAHVRISASRIYVESDASEHNDDICRLIGVEPSKLTQPVIV